MVHVFITGNLFVIAAILLERNLQSVANYLIVSLAVADLMVACLVMPLGAVYEVRNLSYYIKMCELLYYVFCRYWSKLCRMPEARSFNSWQQSLLLYCCYAAILPLYILHISALKKGFGY